MPKNFCWYVNQDANGNIKSPVHTITNNGTIYQEKNATVCVKLASLEPVNNSSVLLSCVNKGSTGNELFSIINSIQTGTVANGNWWRLRQAGQSPAFTERQRTAHPTGCHPTHLERGCGATAPQPGAG